MALPCLEVNMDARWYERRANNDVQCFPVSCAEKRGEVECAWLAGAEKGKGRLRRPFVFLTPSARGNDISPVRSF